MESTKITKSCGNVFADIGLPNPEEMLMKAEIVYKIKQEIKTRNITQKQAAEIMGISQPRLSLIFRGQYINISESKLLHCLNALGYDVKIRIEKSRKNTRGHTSLAFAR